MTDPYVVLGVSRDATDEEIKKKYRELARKYHPDNYANNPLADLAQEKMKTINEAYDAITKERAGGGSQRQSYSQPGSTSYGTSTGPYRDVRAAIMAGDFSRAEMILGSIVDRGAEWNFLMGAVFYHRGWLDEAERYFQTAVSMDPGNAEYRQTLAQLQNMASDPFGSAGGTGTVTTTNCPNAYSSLACCAGLLLCTGGQFFCFPC